MSRDESASVSGFDDWRTVSVVLAALLAVAGVLYWSSLSYLLHLWNDLTVGEYGHGYLVLAISVYLIHGKRNKLARLNPCPRWWPLPAVLVFSLLWLLAVLADIAVAQPVALLLLVFSLLWTLLGSRIMRVLAFPVLFMLFAIPVWFPLSVPLQNLTADSVFYVIRLLQVPAYLQENRIIVPAGVLSVEEACSGLRYLLAALTLGALYAYLNYVSWWARVLVVLVAAATAVLANMLRVLIVVYLGYATEMQHPLISDHLMLGWYIFGALVVILLFVDSRFYRAASAGGDAVTAAAAGSLTTEQDTAACASLPVVATVALVAMLTGPLLLQLSGHEQATAVTEGRLILPAGRSGWSGPQPSDNDWLPKYHGAISEKRDYRRHGDVVSLYIAYYVRQVQGAELVNQLNRISHKKHWAEEYSHPRVMQLDGFEVLEQSLRKNEQQRLVWYWYNIGGHLTVNNYEAKFWQLLSQLQGEHGAYLVAVSVPVSESRAAARQLLRRFVQEMQAGLDRIESQEILLPAGGNRAVKPAGGTQ